MSKSQEKVIDIARVLEEKMGRKSRFVPRWAVDRLRSLVHEDEVNAFLRDSADLVGVPWLDACVRYLGLTLHVEGRENLPSPNDTKRYTFVSNHPLGGIDGVALGSVIGGHLGGDFRYLVNDLLMHLPGLAPLCIPINKTGSQSRAFPAMVEAVFGGPHHVMMFPAGLCSRKINGQIRDIPWSKTFVTKSRQTGRDIIPIHFDGQNSPRFYRIANICKTLGLKVNLAMLFLVDEMYRNRGKTFHITIGKPIDHTTLDNSKTAKQWARHIQDIVYQL